MHAGAAELSGEARSGGPGMRAGRDVDEAGESAADGYNVVIHEFVHKLDMRSGPPNGCPPLPSRAARAAWQEVMRPAYRDFREQLAMAERFGAEAPWLDAYAAQSPAEFFAVAAEAYFVNRGRFSGEFPALTRLFDGFFGSPEQTDS